MKQNVDPYMTLDEIAAEVRMSHGYVLKEVKADKLHGVKFGRLWRVRRSAFTEWDQRRDPKKDPNLIAAGWGR